MRASRFSSRDHPYEKGLRAFKLSSIVGRSGEGGKFRVEEGLRKAVKKTVS